MDTTYRLKGWYLLLNSIIALLTLSSLAGLAVAIILIILVIGFSLQSSPIQDLIPLVMFGGLFILFAGLLTLIGIIFPLGNALFSYLKTGSTGLELRIWPFYRLRCAWHQVSGIVYARIFGGRLSLPMLRIQEAESASRKPEPDHTFRGYDSDTDLSMLPLFLITLLLWSVKYKNLIPVYIFKGWPNGKLRQELERRLGQISFE